MTERVLLDTCVLYPTFLRDVLCGLAEAGLFEPFWSPRILDEWRHAAARSGPLESAGVEAEIARLTARFPNACVTPNPDLQNTLALPDPDDAHVLAAAIAAGADSLLTLNLKDFPTRTVSRHGLFRRDPDGFVMELRSTARETVDQIALDAVARACARPGMDLSQRGLLKRARLPRLGKALFGTP